MGERELPEGWEWKRLGDVLQFSRNGANLKQDKSGNGIPISRIETISYGIVDPTKVGYTQEFDHNIIQKCKLIEGDLLFSHINSLEHIGKTAIYENNPPVLLHGINLLLLRPDKKIVNPKFLHILFKKYRREKMFWSMANKAVNQASINQSRLNKIKIPLPPLPVQRQIVAVLEQAEAVKRQRKEVDAMTGMLLQSVFNEMFGDKVGEENGWEWKKLGDVATSITKGATPTSYGYAFQKSGIKFVKIENIINNQIAESSIVQFISPEAHENQKRSILESGDILFSIAGTIGNVCLVKKEDLPSNINQAIAVIKGTSKVFDPNFLLFFLRTKLALDQIMKKSRGVALNNVSLGDVRDMLVMTPPPTLQQQFARIVESVERIRERQVASGKEIEGLCEGLMQRAFAGELVA